jgi:hypothetical protein
LCNAIGGAAYAIAIAALKSKWTTLRAQQRQEAMTSNAIPLCFECHAEVHHYNPEHPKGRRFGSSELKGHRDQWLRLCGERPEMFVHAQPPPEAGSLERLLSELEFNRVLADTDHLGGAFEMVQFRRAIADGTFTWVSSDVKANVHKAYRTMVKANATLDGFAHRAQTESSAIAIIRSAKVPIEAAIEHLLAALYHHSCLIAA